MNVVAHDRTDTGLDTVPRVSPWDEARTAWAAAFAEFQAIVDNPKKNKTLKVQGRADTHYADLAEIIEVARPVLGSHGLSFAQDVKVHDQQVHVTTTILHKAGHSETFGPLSLPFGNANAQAIGSAITYARRYQLAAVLGLAADDDDGKAAAEKSGGGGAKALGEGAKVSPPSDHRSDTAGAASDTAPEGGATPVARDGGSVAASPPSGRRYPKSPVKCEHTEGTEIVNDKEVCKTCGLAADRYLGRHT